MVKSESQLSFCLQLGTRRRVPKCPWVRPKTPSTATSFRRVSVEVVKQCQHSPAGRVVVTLDFRELLYHLFPKYGCRHLGVQCRGDKQLAEERTFSIFGSGMRGSGWGSFLIENSAIRPRFELGENGLCSMS